MVELACVVPPVSPGLPAAARFATEAKRDEDMRRLTTIPGVSAITAATIKALVPDPGGVQIGPPLRCLGGISTEAPFQRRQGDWCDSRSADCAMIGHDRG